VIQGSRKDGFEHQKLVVLPGPIQKAARRHPILRKLHVTDAGFFPDAKAHGIEREHGAPSAVLIVCLAGRGWVEIGGVSQSVGAGQVVLIAPGQPHAYGSDLTEAWTIVWAHFSGEELGFWWRFLALPKEGGIIRGRCRTPEQLELGRVHEQLAAGFDEPRQIAAASALEWALAHLSSAREAAEGGQDGIEAVSTWMREHVGQRATVTTLARRAGLSPAHFSFRFKQRTGFAPIDYFLRLKIRRACGLLDQTNWTVERIASELGYQDAFYFSRLFRSIMGCPPKAYRNIPKG
jgi:AraC-like DNA-binding protein